MDREERKKMDPSLVIPSLKRWDMGQGTVDSF